MDNQTGINGHNNGGGGGAMFDSSTAAPAVNQQDLFSCIYLHLVSFESGLYQVEPFFGF